MSVMNRSLGLAMVCGLAVAAPAVAQTNAPPSRKVEWQRDSGLVGFDGPVELGARAVYSTVVRVPGAQWLRLHFSAVQLAGVVEEGTGSYLRITSVLDGGTQYLNAVSAEQWVNSSAYLNGDTVLVELMAFPGTGMNRLAIDHVIAGEPAVAGMPPETICGNADNRVLSSDNRSARHMPEGCTSWLWNDTNRMFGSAGHCGIGAGDVQQFNVPLSNANGSTVNPPPEHQYVVDSTSVQFSNGGIGNDWAYFAVFPNSNTGLTPFQAYGANYTLAASAPGAGTPTIRITGYGVNDPSFPVAGGGTWNQVQRTHTGPYAGLNGTNIRYTVDTTGGNSGSAVQNSSAADTIIGAHTHAGCTTAAGTFNNGTAIQLAAWTNARNNPTGLARSGRGTPTGSLFAIGDAVNNFGTCNTASGNFAQVSMAPPRMEGLAYNWNAGSFFAVSNDTFGVTPGAAGRKLWRISPTGVETYVANITGTASVINGLGYDPINQILYGMAQSTGQLFSIHPTTAVATPIGAAGGGTIGAIEFNPLTGILYGIDDSGGASTLVRIDTSNGSRTTVGNLGAGITDCNGLGVTEDGFLWTINASNEQLLRISPSTGVATVIGGTGGFFGAGFGLSAVIDARGACCLPNGSCQLLTSAACTAASGLYRGNNSTCATAPCPAEGTLWMEFGNAGELPGTANRVGVGGRLMEIRGTLGAGNADMYRLRICDFSQFHARTVFGTTEDTQLFLFNANGTGVEANDDDPEPWFTRRQSRLRDEFVTSNGEYLLAVTMYDRDPISGGGLIFPTTPFNAVVGPTGPGGGAAITGWQGSPTTTGDYELMLAGCCYLNHASSLSVASMPAHSSSFSGNTRGYWFTAPVDFRMTGIRVLQEPGGTNGFMNWAVVRFHNNTPPPTFSGTTNAFTQLAVGFNQSSGSTQTLPGGGLDVRAGEVIGVYGNTASASGATTGTNSYTANGTVATTMIFNNEVELTRSGMQFHLGSATTPGGMQDVWQEPTSNQVSRVLFTYAPQAGESLCTFWGSNNSGGLGGAVYFDAAVGSQALTVDGLQMNVTANSGSFGVSVYTCAATSVGNQTNAGAWTLRSTGVGYANPLANQPSYVTLNTPFALNANTSYGIAIVAAAPGQTSAVHAYTNGTSGNTTYPGSHLTLTLGTATNEPFTGTVFNPRTWNGCLNYTLGATGPTCYANCDGSTVVPFLNVADFGCFLSKFAAGDLYANCDGSTVQPVLNVADFGCFLGKFAAGCSAP